MTVNYVKLFIIHMYCIYHGVVRMHTRARARVRVCDFRCMDACSVPGTPLTSRDF